MKTKVLSVRLQSLVEISDKAYNMVKRILLCDWEGSITWNRDFEFNYSKDQILQKNVLKREDEIIKKWMSTL
jgi:hypothetical protein